MFFSPIARWLGYESSERVLLLLRAMVVVAVVDIVDVNVDLIIIVIGVVVRVGACVGIVIVVDHVVLILVHYLVAILVHWLDIVALIFGVLDDGLVGRLRLQARGGLGLGLNLGLLDSGLGLDGLGLDLDGGRSRLGGRRRRRRGLGLRLDLGLRRGLGLGVLGDNSVPGAVLGRSASEVVESVVLILVEIVNEAGDGGPIQRAASGAELVVVETVGLASISRLHDALQVHGG